MRYFPIFATLFSFLLFKDVGPLPLLEFLYLMLESVQGTETPSTVARWGVTIQAIRVFVVVFL